MGNYHYFFIRQVMLLGASDHYVIKKTKRVPCPHEYIYFKFLWTGFYILHWICKSFWIKIPPIGISRRHGPPCLQTHSIVVGGGNNGNHRHHGPNPNKRGEGGLNI